MKHGPGKRGASELGLRLIIIYKLAKAAGEFLLALALVVVLLGGKADTVREFALALSGHVTGAWSVRLTDLLVGAAISHYVELTILALLLDGGLTLFEGWALFHAFTWAPWLVVIATGSLLPLEMFELARRLRAGRLLILLVNLTIVNYLGVRAAREVRARRATY
jgi:uncharacterized membrane protein (DUF2068 family)